MGETLNHKRARKKQVKCKWLEIEHKKTNIREKLTAPTEYEKYRQAMERRKMRIVVDAFAVIGVMATIGTLGFIGLIIVYEIEDRLSKRHECNKQDKCD